MISLDELEKLAKAATPGNLDTAKDIRRGEESDCPVCGEGVVEMDTFTNFDGHAMGVQFFGIGPEFGNYEAYFRACSPDNILALIASHKEVVDALADVIGLAELVASRDDISEDAEEALRYGWRMLDALEVLKRARAALSHLEAKEVG